MPITITLNANEIIRATANLGKAHQWVPATIHKQMPILGKQIKSLMQDQLKSHRYLGTLGDSVGFEYETNLFTLTIGPMAKRGRYDAGMIAEMGTVPIDNLPWRPIKEWAEAHNRSPRATWLTIRKKGVQPHPFLMDTMNRMEFSAALMATSDIIGTQLAAQVFAGDKFLGGAFTP